MEDYKQIKRRVEKFLSSFLNKKASSWIYFIPDSFLKWVLELHEIDFKIAKKKPGTIGIILNDLVYKRIQPSIYEILICDNPNNYKNKQINDPNILIPMQLEAIYTMAYQGGRIPFDEKVDLNIFYDSLDRFWPVQAQQYDTLLDK